MAGIFYCQRCQQYAESHDGDCIEDPDDDIYMIHESCQTEAELEKEAV